MAVSDLKRCATVIFRVKQMPFMQGVLRAQSDMKWIAVKDIKIVCINGGKVSFSDCHDEYCGIRCRF